MTVSFKVLIDWQNNGNFTDSYDDVTDDVLGGIKINVGKSDPHGSISTNTCDLRLNNNHYRYTKNNNSSPLYGYILLKRKIQIQVIYDGTTYKRFTGFIRKFEYTFGFKPSVSISCSDIIEDLQNDELEETGNSSRSTLTEHLQGLLETDAGYDSSLFSYDSELNNDVFDSSDYKNDIKLLDLVKEYINAFQNYFYVDGEGVLNFKHRHYGLKQGIYKTYSFGNESYAIGSCPIQFNDDEILNKIKVATNTGIGGWWREQSNDSINKYGPKSKTIDYDTNENHLTENDNHAVCFYVLSRFNNLIWAGSLNLIDQYPDMVDLTPGKIIKLHDTESTFEQSFEITGYSENITREKHDVTFNLMEFTDAKYMNINYDDKSEYWSIQAKPGIENTKTELGPSINMTIEKINENKTGLVQPLTLDSSGGQIDTVKFYLTDFYSPTDAIECKIWDNSSSSYIATSNETFNTNGLHTFTFPSHSLSGTDCEIVFLRTGGASGDFNGWSIGESEDKYFTSFGGAYAYVKNSDGSTTSTTNQVLFRVMISNTTDFDLIDFMKFGHSDCKYVKVKLNGMDGKTDKLTVSDRFGGGYTIPSKLYDNNDNLVATEDVHEFLKSNIAEYFDDGYYYIFDGSNYNDNDYIVSFYYTNSQVGGIDLYLWDGSNYNYVGDISRDFWYYKYSASDYSKIGCGIPGHKGVIKKWTFHAEAVNHTSGEPQHETKIFDKNGNELEHNEYEFEVSSKQDYENDIVYGFENENIENIIALIFRKEYDNEKTNVYGGVKKQEQTLLNSTIKLDNSNHKLSQSIKFTNTGGLATLCQVYVDSVIGSPTGLKARIRDNLDGSIIAVSDETYDNSFTTGWIDFNFSNGFFKKDTSFYVELYATGTCDSSNYWNFATADNYANGTLYKYDGSSWSDQNIDLAFKVFCGRIWIYDPVNAWTILENYKVLYTQLEVF